MMTKLGSTLPERKVVLARQNIHNGLLAIIFKVSDYYRVMAAECRLMIVGGFVKPKHQIDQIWSNFKEKITVNGSIKICVFDNFNIFINFSNEENFNIFWYKRFLTIDGQQIWLEK